MVRQPISSITIHQITVRKTPGSSTVSCGNTSKGTDLARWTSADLQGVTHALNTRPRKTLGWRTPAEALNEQLISVQQAGVASTGRIRSYTSIKFTETLMLQGLCASIGTVGDAYDALAESTIALYKTECIGENDPFHTSPYKDLTDVEFGTKGWINWYNQRRLHGSIGFIPPAEFETTNYYAQ